MENPNTPAGVYTPEPPVEPEAPLGIIRASGLAEMFDCSYRWYSKHILKLRTPGTISAHLGTSIHAGAEAFDKARMEERPISVGDAKEAFFEKFHRPEGDLVVDEDGDPPRVAEAIGLALTEQYCENLAPLQSYTAVELDCGICRFNTPHGPILLRGKTDRVKIGSDGLLRIADIKTGKRAVSKEGKVDTRGHHLQLGIYTLIAEARLEEVLSPAADVIGMATLKTDARVNIGTVAEVKRPLLGSDGQPGILDLAAGILKAGIFPPNPKSVLCSPKYCPAWTTCKYHQ